jgi:predicted DNA-binding transcriptional regulator YafY
MSKTARLFQLMTALRSLPAPVTAEVLSQELNVSMRTIYRDVDELRGLGAVIDGEAGFGFTLIEDASLPPLGFEDDELEALVLGLRDVAVIGDPALAKAARSALAKITSRVPQKQAHRLEHAVLDARRWVSPPKPSINVASLREATWAEHAVEFEYEDAQAVRTKRRVWPLGIVYLEASSVLLAWCLLRQDYRSFRLDRMSDLNVTSESFRPRRVSMLRDHIDRLRKEAPLVAAG